MADITAKLVMTLRDKTGLGMMKCKEALVETAGDIEKAVDHLRKMGLDAANKRAGRATSEGLIGSYMHVNGKLGVMLEINCESDFVAMGDAFQGLVKDICMHVAATDPVSVSADDVAQDVIEHEREIYRGQVKNKPAEIVDKIIDGKMKKFYAERCLLEQPFVKNTDMTVGELVSEAIAKLGENITVRRFVRFQLGEDL